MRRTERMGRVSYYLLDGSVDIVTLLFPVAVLRFYLLSFIIRLAWLTRFSAASAVVAIEMQCKLNWCARACPNRIHIIVFDSPARSYWRYKPRNVWHYVHSHSEVQQWCQSGGRRYGFLWYFPRFVYLIGAKTSVTLWSTIIVSIQLAKIEYKSR